MTLAADAITAPRVPGLAIDVSEARLAEHLSAAVRRFGAVALGLVDLPPLEVATPTRAELGVAAVLLWAHHVDEAGLLDVLDALADGVVRGTLPLAITGPATRRLLTWHRRRGERFTAPERRALYERVLGDTVADGLRGLIDTLVELGHAAPRDVTAHAQVRVAMMARQLAGELAARATGIAGFAARDIVDQIREALAVLADPELAAALGGGGAWTLVARHAPTLLGRRVDVSGGVGRATAGRALLGWLADHVAEVGAGTLAPRPGDALVRAAMAYREGA